MWSLLTQILAMCSFIALYIKQGVAMVNQPCSKWTRWFFNGLTVSGNKEAMSNRWSTWWAHSPRQTFRAWWTRESSGPCNTKSLLLSLQTAVFCLQNLSSEIRYIHNLFCYFSMKKSSLCHELTWGTIRTNFSFLPRLTIKPWTTRWSRYACRSCHPCWKTRNSYNWILLQASSDFLAFSTVQHRQTSAKTKLMQILCLGESL